jgi:CubicO group peptidase (beta-lactamase class C family)
MDHYHQVLPALFLAALFVIFSGCMTAQSPAQSVTPATAPATTQATVDDAKLQETIAWLDTAAEQQRKEWNIPGMAVAVVNDGKIVFVKGYGVKRAGTTDPVTTDTVFEIGSTSKAFTATTVAEQVDKGKMNWTDPVVWYVPYFQMKDKNVTNEYSLTDSMSQRSGIPEQWGLDVGTLGYNRSEVISALRYAEPEGNFRTSYAYQNLPWLTAAAAVENTSGKSWDENVREGIFDPLNLTSGSTTFAGLTASPDHVTLHRMVRLDNGTIIPIPMEENWTFHSWVTVMSPAGGLNMNIRDFATWAAFQTGNGTWNGKQIVTNESMNYMHSPKVLMSNSSSFVTGAKESYDQGWVTEELPNSPAIVWHNGNALGGHAMIMLVPDERLGVVVLENEAGPTAGDALAFQFYNKYFLNKEDPTLFATYHKNMKTGYAYLFNPPSITKPDNPTHPLGLTKYTGSYTNDEYGPAKVTQNDGNLTLFLGKTPVILNLTHWDSNTFTSTCPAWGPDYSGWVTFGTNTDGSVRSLTTSLFLETDLYHKNATFIRTGSA